MQTIVGPVVVTKEGALGSICGRLRRALAAASPIAVSKTPITHENSRSGPARSVWPVR